MPRKFRKKKSVARDSHLLRAAALLMKSQHAFSSHAHVQPSFPHFLDENVSRFYDLKGTTTQQQKKGEENKKSSSSSRMKKTQSNTNGRARAQSGFNLQLVCVLCQQQPTFCFVLQSKRVGDESSRRNDWWPFFVVVLFRFFPYF